MKEVIKVDGETITITGTNRWLCIYYAKRDNKGSEEKPYFFCSGKRKYLEDFIKVKNNPWGNYPEWITKRFHGINHTRCYVNEFIKISEDNEQVKFFKVYFS